MPLTPRDRRTLMIGGGILGFLLVAFFLFNTLSGGGGEVAVPSFSPISTAPDGDIDVGSPSPSPGISPQPVFTGRDPFSIPPGLATDTGGGSGSPTDPTDSPTNPTDSPTNPTDPTDPPTNPPGTDPPTTPGGNSSTVLGGKTVVLLDTFRQGGELRAQFEVDGTVFNVGIGDRFGQGSFQLQSISGNCATFLFGDEPQTLCANSTK